MRKCISLLTGLFLWVVSTAQNQETVVINASAFHITPPLSEMFAGFTDADFPVKTGESADRLHRDPQHFEFTVDDGPEYGNDPRTIQEKNGDIPSEGPRASWAGLTSGYRPFDPSGAAGPNHYVQMINATTFRVFNKNTGATMLTGTLGNLWSPSVGNNGDPIVMYDKAADRWFLAQFGTTSNRRIYIAVSTTNDPTGSYYTYTFVSPQFPDYLKFSVWQDGYYMTSNQSTQKVFCFERAAMLAGIPGARGLYVNYSPPRSGFFCPLPGDAADGTLPPTGTPCPILSYEDNGWGSGYVDRINIYNMTVNWAATPTASISLASQVPVAAFDGSYNSSWNDVSQPNTSQRLDGIGGVLMYRAQWKSWSGYNTIVVNWAVRISSTQRSIKWAELRQNQTTGVWSVFQEGIYTPDAATRWMGSIAMDNNGSIGLSYMKSNSTNIFPGLYYTGRRTCDPPGTLPITEALVIAGTGSQTGTNRVGDYAHTTLDPDGVTFWSTSEFMGGNSGSSAARTRIFSFQIPPCSSTASVNISVTSGSNPSCSGVAVTFTATAVNGGSSPSYQWKVNGNNVGTNSATFTSSTLSSGDVVTCVMTSNAPGVLGSPATSNSISMTITSSVTPTVSIAQVTGSNPGCSGQLVGFTATGVNAGSAPQYQWSVNGVNTGGNSPNFNSSTLPDGAVISCSLTTSLACAVPAMVSSNSVIMAISSTVVPGVSIAITGGSNPTTTGDPVVFTATAVNGGSSPAFQWLINGSVTGITGPVFTTSTLNNGAVVTCQLTSSLSCAIPTTALSNSIAMTVVGVTPVYCAASTANVGPQFEYIKKVVCGSINKSSQRSSYSDFTAWSTTVLKGTSRTFTISLGNGFSTDRVLIWCDWNNNGSFTDPGEAVYVSPAGVGPFSGSFMVPMTAVTGSIRMRIRLTDTASGTNETPCGVSGYGEVEDYTIHVVDMLSASASDDANVEENITFVEGGKIDSEFLVVYPNPNSGTFSIKGVHEGTYYIVSSNGQLVEKFLLNRENEFMHTVSDLASGMYVVSGQNEFGVSHQKIIVGR